MSLEVNKNSYKPFEEKMQNSIKRLEDEFNTIRAGRANPKLLDKLTVEYYGVETPFNQVSNIQVPEARMIVITPFDPSILKDMVKAINMSDLGINPQEDGSCIRLIFPPLTEERRKDLCKDISKLGEESKVSVRNARREGIDTYRTHEKNKEISEDELRLFEENMQKLTDKYTDKIDKMVEAKEKEVMSV